MAEPEPTETDTSKYSRLTRSDIGVLIKLRKDGFSQPEIAQRLGCTQSTVSKWCREFTDMTLPAKEFLKGSSLRMAKNIVNNGKPSDHVRALEGLGGVLDAGSQAAGGVTIIVGGDAHIALLHGPRTRDDGS